MLRIAAIVVGLAVTAVAQVGTPLDPDAVLDKHLTVPWRDDAISHPDLVRFRESLMRAAKRRDLKAILESSDPDRVTGCSLDAPPEDVETTRGLHVLRDYFEQASKEFDPWSGFYDSLSSGGVLSEGGRRFTSNYAVWNFPANRVGALGPEYFFVMNGADIAVFERPAPDSKIVARLSYNIVIPEESKAGKRWQKIAFGRGKRGFVRSKNLISPIGLSTSFELRLGRWRLTGIHGYCE
jgi:hypothetical protein